MYLERINGPWDLKALGIKELEELAHEIRAIIIDVVSKNGGHLASNLGVVELTIALHYVFDSPKDVIIWDVGHQSYTHKLLTGRRDHFETLRKDGGISGFPRREESIHDAFNTGHASTAISAALGIRLARELMGEEGEVVAVVGDGSLSGGMAFEALNHAGHLKKDIMVVLNTNEMSISPSVGALSGYLNRLITMPVYNRLRKDINTLLKRVPRFGPKMLLLKERIEEGVKHLVVPGALFEELGFRYFGPIDGHHLPSLINMIKRVKGMGEPRLIHVVTKKGKGYRPAEENPSLFHSSPPFNPVTGRAAHKKTSVLTYSEIFGQAICELAEKDPRIVAITAAMKDGTGLSLFAQDYPDRFFDVGIAEGHAVTLAAGLAAKGLRPVVAIYSTFLQRGYDQIIHDVCLQNLPVIFAVDRGGIVGEDGPTHHGIFDIAYLRHIPNLILMVPKDEAELVAMLRMAIGINGPVAIRYPKDSGRGVPLDRLPEIKIGKAEMIVEGRDGCILSVGRMIWHCLEALGYLRDFGIELSLVNARFIKPLDKELIRRMAKNGPIITVEEGILEGGFGSAIAELLVDEGIVTRIKRIGLQDRFIEHGETTRILARYGLDPRSIADTVKLFLQRNELKVVRLKR